MNNKFKYYGMELLLIIILSCTLIFNSFLNSKIKVAIFLLLYSFLMKIIFKKDRVLSVKSKKVVKMMLLMSIIYVVILYTLGIYAGYYNSKIAFSLDTIINYIIPIFLIIYSSEVIRTKFLNLDTKLSLLLNFIIQVLIDLLIYINTFRINSVDELMLVIGYILFASISCNLLYNYIAKRYGMKPNIIYRLITVLYIYIIPITPDIYIFFLSFYRMIYPLAIYFVLESFYGDIDNSLEIKSNIIIRIITIMSMILLTIYIALISCMFTYGALVIGSGSMRSTIDKGDVIIFNKDINAADVEVGQIIIFNKSDVKIVHRVIDKQYKNGKYIFYTKGDNNKLMDEGFVSEKELYATLSFKIKYIGLPTVWLNEMFKK